MSEFENLKIHTYFVTLNERDIRVRKSNISYFKSNLYETTRE